MLRFQCTCGASFKADRAASGRIFNCPKCKQPVKVPTESNDNELSVLEIDDVGLKPLDNVPASASEEVVGETISSNHPAQNSQDTPVLPKDDDEEETQGYQLEEASEISSPMTGDIYQVRLPTKSEVSTLAISEQFPIGLVAAEDRIFVINCKIGKRLYTFQQHEADVTCAAISKDGKSVISGDTDGTVIYWNLATGKCHSAWQLHDEEVNSLAFSPTGKFAVCGGEDGITQLMRVADGRTKQLQGGDWERAVNSVAFSPDGNYILAGGVEKVMLWQAKTGKIVHQFPQKGNPIGDVSFSSCGKYFQAATAVEFSVFRWETSTGLPAQLLRIPESSPLVILDTALLANDDRIITVGMFVKDFLEEIQLDMPSLQESLVKGASASLLGGLTGVSPWMIRAGMDLYTNSGSQVPMDDDPYLLQVWRFGDTEPKESYPIGLIEPDSITGSATFRRILLGFDGHTKIFGIG